MKKLSSFLSKISFFALMSMLMATPISLQAIEASQASQSDTVVSKKPEPSQASGEINGHAYVDLGLSVKWATCNVGASKPEGYGLYYAWGEIKTKSYYNEKNSETHGKELGDIGGDPRYDVAQANWGGSWRLPTKAEQDELRENCDWTWTTQNGVNGYVVTSKVNGNSIFLPASGWWYMDLINYAESEGYYWSSTPHESDMTDAYYISFYDGRGDSNHIFRDRGRSVRPVTK